MSFYDVKQQESRAVAFQQLRGEGLTLPRKSQQPITDGQRGPLGPAAQS